MKANVKGHTPYDSNYATCCNRQHYEDTKNISGYQGLGGRGTMNKQSTEDIKNNENILYDTIMVDICPYTFVQTQRIYNTKEP